MKVRVSICGRHYDQALGLPKELELAEGCRLSEALRALAAAVPADSPLPDSCLVAVSGKHLGTVSRHRDQALNDGDELMVLAPLAGG